MSLVYNPSTAIFAGYIKGSHHWTDVSRKLGYKCGSNRTRIIERCEKEKVNYQHLDEKKFSRIWLLTDDEFRELVKKSIYKIDIYNHLGYTGHVSAERHLKKRIAELNIDISHFRLKGNRTIFRKGTKRTPGNRLKQELLKHGVAEKCVICGLLPVWQGKTLVLTVDHIDGDPTNDLKDNLRLLCPNCHSQTSTFGGKNVRKIMKSKGYNSKCLNCQVQLAKTSRGRTKRCHKCDGLKNRKVQNRPPLAQLQNDVRALGYVGTGRKYAVSDSAIRKWIKCYEKEQLIIPTIKIRPVISLRHSS